MGSELCQPHDLVSLKACYRAKRRQSLHVLDIFFQLCLDRSELEWGETSCQKQQHGQHRFLSTIKVQRLVIPKYQDG